ncbi:MAG: MBL fold metallo-hydrolase [Candidatus Syntrophopropionicum ammoniitolerans]
MAPNSENYENLNDYSVVIRLTHGENSFLFTGDAEAVSENEMLEKNHALKADVLKVGHHGSDTSTTASFLKAVSPRYAVISVGGNNTYGHPSPAVVDRLSAAQIEIYRTDQDGTIFATSDGEKISVRKIASSPIKPNAPPTTTQETEQPAPQTSQEVAPPTPVPTPEPAPTPTPTPAPVPAPTVQSEASSSDTTVYITNTGKKYHTSGCSSLSKSKIPISLQDAKNRGYGPCARCHPPQ